ncbi:cobalamin biosynthesis protein CobQ [Methyloceanibacter marginalis]|uniref:Cobyric acid synthase n=1 Tax=Methyloceanibacter marginalis TaxID=1774971 RepID=A0A1E3WAI1_9HYPH|nr:cobyric acid synthase [Methyloceanibacter marginalis]ODS02730.1 cobalamin biosynthesis protein CobQ [Methyloceanibacter marginalis]
MSARALMFQGTGSDVGKSLVVAGLARALHLRGLKVLPFKPQNMSNNAAVTADGGEIGRAQALQARAAGVAPSVHMNPVLLKPQSEVGAQIVVQGRVYGKAKAADYQVLKPELMGFVQESFARLKAEADIVLVEGAGSAAEVNLRENDIANMGFARAFDVPIILIGDIDRGGVIASLAGTKAVLDANDAGMIVGFLVNKFRGDPALFAGGMTKIAEITGWQALGLIPFFAEARALPAEDALALDAVRAEKRGAALKIAVPILPHIANFDDLDPLDAEPAIELVRVRPGQALPGDAALMILPGSKATLSDLKALREAGFDIDIAAHLRRGGMLLGLCGGYQMLGRVLHDPDGIEGPPGTAQGLGLLDVETTLSSEKRLEPARGTTFDGAPFSGYEMHMGVTDGPDCVRTFATLETGTPEGAMSADGRVIATYVHGLFADDRQRAAWLARFAAGAPQIAYEASVDEILDRLAAHLVAHVDIDTMLTLSR